MYKSFQDLLVTRQLLNVSKTIQLTPKELYEVENILERFIVSLVNNNNTNYIYPATINKDDIDSTKLISELKEKHISHTVFDYVLNIINKERSDITDIKYTVSYTKTNYQINFVYISDNIPKSLKLDIELGARKLLEMRQHRDIDVVRMLILYDSMASKGQQWAIPENQYRYLNEIYDVNYEGFASPINSGLSDKKNGKFCSLFPEVDKPFGSIGKFFEQNLYAENKRHWSINPPFVEELIRLTSDKIINDIEYAIEHGLEVMVFYILPHWQDCQGFIDIWNYKHTKHREVLNKGTYNYECKGKLIRVPINSAVMIIDSYNKKIDYSQITKKMRTQ